MKVHHVGAKIAALGLFALVSFGIFLYLFTAAGGQLRTKAPYRVSVLLPEAFQLVKNSDVRMGGVKVGRVDTITNQGVLGKVTIELKDQHAPLNRDAQVIVRTKTLVGENYLDITPGTPQAGTIPDGDTVPLRQAQEAVAVDKVLSTFDAPTRARVKQNLRALAAGLGDRGSDLNAALASLRPTVGQGEKVTAALARQRDRVASLIDDAGNVMGALSVRDQQLRGLIVDARRSAQAVAARDERLGQTLDALPGTLAQVRSSVGVLSQFSRDTTPVVASLRRGLIALEPAARDLAPAATQARAITRELKPTLTRLDAVLPALQQFAKRVPAASDGLVALLRQANPFVDYIEPYRKDAASFFANMGAPFNTDAMGYVGHVKALANASTLKVFSPQEKKALDALIYSGLVGKLNNPQVNNYPKAGTSGDPQPWDGTYSEVKPRR